MGINPFFCAFCKRNYFKLFLRLCAHRGKIHWWAQNVARKTATFYILPEFNPAG